MREKAVAAFGAAPGRDRDVVDAELARLLREGCPEIESNRAAATEARRDFRTYLIALAANPYTAVHYNLSRGDITMGRELLDGARQHADSGAPPPRVQERNDALVRQREIHRDAVGDRDGEQHAGLRGGMPIDAIEDQPALGQLLVPPDRRAGDLMREDDGRKARGEGGAERAPAAHDLPDGLLAPQSETHRPSRDAGDEPVPIRPLRQLEARQRRVADRRFARFKPGAQAALPVLATACRCARSRARFVRCSG